MVWLLHPNGRDRDLIGVIEPLHQCTGHGTGFELRTTGYMGRYIPDGTTWSGPTVEGVYRLVTGRHDEE